MAAMRERAKHMRRRDVFAGEGGGAAAAFRGEERSERRPWRARAEIVIDEHMLYLLGRSCDQAGSAVCEEGGRWHCFFHCAPLFSSLHFPYGLLLCASMSHGAKLHPWLGL